MHQTEAGLGTTLEAHGLFHAELASGKAPEGVKLEPAAEAYVPPFLWADFSKPPPTLDWVVPDFLAVGAFTLMVGAPKAGKSTLVTVWQRDGGLEWMGREIRECVWWYFYEESDGAIRHRHTRMGYDPDLAGHQFAYRNPDAGWPPTDLIEAIGRTYDEAPVKPTVICLDTMLHWLPSDDANDASAVARQMSPIYKMQRMLPDVAILVLHQTRKAGGDNAVEAVQGSQQLAASADIVVRLQRMHGGGKATIQGRYNEPDPITYTLDTDSYQYTAGRPLDTLDEWIVEHLGAAPEVGWSVKDLFEAASEAGADGLKGERQFKVQLDRLAGAGHIQKAKQANGRVLYSAQPIEDTETGLTFL